MPSLWLAMQPPVSLDPRVRLAQMNAQRGISPYANSYPPTAALPPYVPVLDVLVWDVSAAAHGDDDDHDRKWALVSTPKPGSGLLLCPLDLSGWFALVLVPSSIACVPPIDKCLSETRGCRGPEGRVWAWTFKPRCPLGVVRLLYPVVRFWWHTLMCALFLPGSQTPAAITVI